MPRPFNANLYEGTCKPLGYLFYLHSTKEMKIKAAVTIRYGKCSLTPPRFCRVSLCKMSVCKNVKAKNKWNISKVKMKTAISTFGPGS